MFKLNKTEAIGLIFAAATILIDFIFLRDLKIFYFIIGISFIMAAAPFMIYIIIDSAKEKEKEEMFLEFFDKVNSKFCIEEGRKLKNMFLFSVYVLSKQNLQMSQG